MSTPPAAASPQLAHINSSQKPSSSAATVTNATTTTTTSRHGENANGNGNGVATTDMNPGNMRPSGARKSQRRLSSSSRAKPSIRINATNPSQHNYGTYLNNGKSSPSPHTQQQRIIQNEATPLLNTQSTSIQAPQKVLSPAASLPLTPLYNTNPTPPQQIPSSFSIAFSIAIMILINFLDFVLFAIIFPSLLYYIQSLGGDETFYSWTLFAYSLAQACAAPVLGYWAQQRTFKEVISLTLALEVLASVVYALAQEKWMIFASRLALGIAAGSSAVTKAYFSAATTSQNRTLVMTLATLAQALGFVAGPGIGGALAFIDWTLRESSPRIVFDKYTMAGWFSAVLGLICAVLTVFCLKQPVTKQSALVKRRRTIPKRDLEWKQEEIVANSPRCEVIPKENFEEMINDDPQLVHYYQKVHLRNLRKKPESKISMVPVVVLLFCWFTSTTSFTIFETLAAAISKDQYGWDVKENAAMWLSTAAASIVLMALFMAYTNVGPKIPVVKYFVFKDRMLCIFSFVGMLAGFGIMTKWSGHLHIARWIVGAFFISCSISVNQTLITSLYSLVLDANNQGSWMGYQTTFGCIARIIAPLLAVFIYKEMGDGPVFITAEILLVLSIVAILGAYLWILPHASQQQNDSNRPGYKLQVNESSDSLDSSSHIDAVLNGDFIGKEKAAPSAKQKSIYEAPLPVSPLSMNGHDIAKDEPKIHRQTIS